MNLAIDLYIFFTLRLLISLMALMVSEKKYNFITNRTKTAQRNLLEMERTASEKQVDKVKEEEAIMKYAL